MQTDKKTIIDLCGGTGSWSNNYAEAGYRVVIVDPLAEPGPNVEAIASGVVEVLSNHGGLFDDVHGVLAAPPCTQFASSGARWWSSKPPELLAEAESVVLACLEIIRICDPKWWALENPVGRLPKLIGPYKYTFQPTEYGDPWHKRTCIWGTAAMPPKLIPPVERNPALDPWRLPPSANRWRLRSKTPPGFAKAFFEANK